MLPVEALWEISGLYPAKNGRTLKEYVILKSKDLVFF
jgi:hypothetical protein